MVVPTDRSLAEQMHLTDLEVGLRKRLFEFSDDDVAALASVRNTIAVNVNAIVDEFYRRQTRIPEIALVIGDSDTLGRLKGYMRRYVLEMFSGQIDADYVALRLRVGKVHHRLGVTPKLFLAALWMLSDVVMGTLERNAASGAGDRLVSVKAAIRKILLFDAGLVFDTYIHAMAAEATMAKEQAERYAATLEDVVVQRTQQIQRLSETDTVTGLTNRAGFNKHLRTLAALAERTGSPLSMAYIDIDDFKAVNDRLGHAAGDAVLQWIAQALNDTKRQTDVACRLGGDEFAMLLPGATAAEGADVMNRLVAMLDDVGEPRVYVSIGVAQFDPAASGDPEAMVRATDAAMYRAKWAQSVKPANTVVIAEVASPDDTLAITPAARPVAVA
ncbi:MAG: GGDEF domain-containing protein [Alphaproteobacteria bacterium]